MSNQLQHRLQNFEATPPSNAWLAIEEGLNTPDSSALQERLAAFEAQPPEYNWNKIITELDTITTLTKRPIRHIGLRYAAAAILLGVLALGIIRFTTGNSEKALAKQVATKPSIKNTPTPVDQNTSHSNNNSKHSGVSFTESIDQEATIVTETTITSSNTKLSKRYTVVANGDGQVVRLSKKAYAVFDCAIKSTTMRARCKEDIETMQAKMANTMASPTTDFAGLIDMIKTLEENK